MQLRSIICPYITRVMRLMMLTAILTTTVRQHLLAQNKPAATRIPVAKPVPLPPSYVLSAVNSIRSWTPSRPLTDPGQVVVNSRTVGEVRLETRYFDGLGRLLQTVDKQASPTGRDLVIPCVYDAFGREQFSYLPYTQKNGTQNGLFKQTPFNAQQEFYRDIGLSPGTGADSIYYAQTLYEAAPLNREMQTWSPGNAWAKEGGNRPIKQFYLINTINDSVRCWRLSSTTVLPVSGSIYNSGSLYKDVTVNEAGVKTVTYRDLEEHIILTKTQLAANPGSAHVGWLCTYYVYDNIGNLRFVIPPKAVDIIRGNWAVSTTVASELCFIYRYDNRARMIVRKMPGADSVEMIYDKRDRLVASRDGIMKVMGQWHALWYDPLNREQKTGLINLVESRAALQQRIDLISPGAQDPFSFLSAVQIRILTNTYYDNYNFPDRQAYNTADLTKLSAGANQYAETLPASASTRTKSLTTAKRVRIEATEQFITSSIYYDHKGRIIQTIANNIAGGKDVTSNRYDFSGKVLSTYIRHTNPRSILTPQTTVLTMFDYDARGRLDSIKKRINDDVANERTIAVNTYDELGRLRSKRLDVTGVNTQLETLQYEYNTRGWLKSVNGAFVNTPNSTTNWFGQEYCYEYGFDSTAYTGNIAGIKWKSGSDGIARAYGMGYDRIDRLTYASFTQQQAGNGLWTNNKVDFSVTGLAYDGGGNILSMNQKGLNGTAVRTIDSLKYGYFANSNRLNYVTDRTNDPTSILGDFHEQDNRETQDYWYDPNGNVSKDKNKSVDTVLYNYQQLPAILLAKNRKASIHYLYAAGQHDLLAKMVSDTSIRPHLFRVTNYINGFQYEQDTLRFINQEEGRIRPIYQPGKPVQYTIDYCIKDNLGNVRILLGTRRDTTIYQASMETATAAKENALFSNIELTRNPKPVGCPEDKTTDVNTYVARLNAANGQKIGPALVLRVMAGDSIRIGVRAFLKDPGASKSSVNAEEMAAALLRALSGDIGKENKFDVMDNIPSSAGINGSIYTQLKEKDPAENLSDNPKAYLCFAAFDEQFNLISENAGAKQVQRATDVLQTLVSPSLRIQKSGYLYIYTSNESARDVYFDNLTVTRISSPLLEETHYYPFGLTMAGISSSALKESTYPVNKKRYNGIELNTDLDLNEYDAFYRTLDPQTGRWKQIDPKIEKMEAWSPYASNFNNPMRYSDLLGDEPSPIKGFFKALGALANIMAGNISRMAAENRRENMTVVRNTVNKGIGNFKGRIATGTTTPQLIYKELRENPLAAVTGLGGLELRGAAFAAEEFVATSKVANTGGKVGESVERSAKMSGKLDGAGRAAKYKNQWDCISLNDAIEKFAPGSKGVISETKEKTFFLNEESGIQVVYDNLGDYFRIENTRLSGKRTYLDMNGRIPNNKIVNGKQMGRNQSEYEQVTHFKNTDAK
ncbi:RHS repeat-associated core domain-containing protein [Chitinophaga sp. YR627]|uniref:DUF6443 domain-containing protein n=1 Tax=Chitinophaga sp. YR627 TaxID=1881041 RepID=UPI0008EE29B4|nr:DUF6443 domain-containing protein [Chitinophaga sp. YR627]SFM92195.1 RHS repeat-associated core domain-containing protein [Chitinophaga sp. YR627]